MFVEAGSVQSMKIITAKDPNNYTSADPKHDVMDSYYHNKSVAKTRKQ